ncbi:MAG: OadG family protein [Chromatiaceae bacterium]|nr:OadG family protein [Gammaproteobacteria bacterium]MCB1879545.1 OadG family protein [Gammaproteobacteria bacterium]MCB1902918.1 OadG family protein [Gammaproteobacteria bacterium]MCP5445737.1 OadG family protein [Chromatiaceae bacterium]
MTDLIIKSLGMYGLTIVISMLAALLIKLIVVVIAKTEDSRKRAKSSVASVQAPVLGGQVDPRHVAAISAAVYAVLGSHRIVHIERGKNIPSWAAEGKRQLQTSHNVHRT